MSSNGILGFKRKVKALDARMEQQLTERVNPDRLARPESPQTRFAPPSPFHQAETDQFPVQSQQPVQPVQPQQPVQPEPVVMAQDALAGQPAPSVAAATQVDNAVAPASPDHSNLQDEGEMDPELREMAEEYWRQVAESRREEQQGTRPGQATAADVASRQTVNPAVNPAVQPTTESQPRTEIQPTTEIQPGTTNTPANQSISRKTNVDVAKFAVPYGDNHHSIGNPDPTRVEDDSPAMPHISNDRRNAAERIEGHVAACDSNVATVLVKLDASQMAAADHLSVGKLITIRTPHSRVTGVVYRVSSADDQIDDADAKQLLVEVELMGEVTEDRNGFILFSPGINNFPTVGCVAHRIRVEDLAAIYNVRGVPQSTIGMLSQDTSVPAYVCLEKMISSHFALVGTTGVGKSSAASLLVRKLLEEKPDLRVLILDPHNEFARAFPEHAVTIDVDRMQLPYWMFQFAEIVEVIYRGNKPLINELDVLRDLIPAAKTIFASREGVGGACSLVKKSASQRVMTVDNPVPYRISDLIALIDEELGRLEGRHERSTLKSLKGRINSLANDPRFAFMFPQRGIEDNMAEILGQIFRIPHNGRPITTFELSGIPSEVTNVVVSVLSRMAFDLAVMGRGSCEVLVLCEEAHRYIPADTETGFAPTRAAIARIAKEGRKYGAYLGIVTQRPSELDSTILSQCSTIFAMRLANAADQEIIRSAISNSTHSTVNFLSSIGNREAIAFGAGVATPMRMQFAEIPGDELPDAPVDGQFEVDLNGNRVVNLAGMIQQIRGG